MLETEVQSLDPQIATDGTSFEVIADYTDGLMQMDADGAAVPAIAETYDISEDGKTYTFHLRDAKWSNGDAVTAADFVFGWQRAVDPANASEYSYMLSDIGQVVNAAEIIAGEKPVTDLGVTAVLERGKWMTRPSQVPQLNVLSATSCFQPDAGFPPSTCQPRHSSHTCRWIPSAPAPTPSCPTVHSS